MIASHRAAAAPVLSRRNAGKLSWRRAVSKRRGEMEICRLDWIPVIFGGWCLRCLRATSKIGLYSTVRYYRDGLYLFRVGPSVLSSLGLVRLCIRVSSSGVAIS